MENPTTGQIVWRWDSDPFGTTARDEDPDGDTNPFTLPLRFQGQYLDSETGLHYNYFRDYEPATGRYVQSDPIGLEGGLNTYLYAAANPVTFVDPDGQNPGVAARGGWVLGRAAGLVLDRLLLGATGTTLGGVIYEMCNESADERERRCQENLDRDLKTCSKGSTRYGKDWYRVCEQQAMLRYSNCLSGRDKGIDAPLPPWGRL